MLFIIVLIIIGLSVCATSYYLVLDEIVQDQKKQARNRFNKQNKKEGK